MNDFFCGCGGMGLAFRDAGYEIAGAWDIDKYAVETYQENNLVIEESLGGGISRHIAEEAGLLHANGIARTLRAGWGDMTKKHNSMHVLVPVGDPLIPDGDQEASAILHSQASGGLKTRLDGVSHFLRGNASDGSKAFLVERTVLEIIPDGNDCAALRSVRTEYGKSIRKDYEAGKVEEKWSNIRRLEPRPDGISNTLTTVLKDNLLMERAESSIEVIGKLEQSGTTQEHNNRVHDPGGISPTLTTVAGGTHHIKIFDYHCCRVRRLTPSEYGRLQAFPVDD